MKSSVSLIARTARVALLPTARQAIAGPSRLAIVSSIPSTSRTSFVSRRHASSSSTPPSPTNPSESKALALLEEGTKLLENGDFEGARVKYKESFETFKTGSATFNLGVAEYHLQNTPAAIEAWKTALEIDPSPDAHTNLASAYILSKPSNPALAIRHLKEALTLAPNDPEIAFNLAAVLESTGNLSPALKLYQKAVDGGIERASSNVMNVAAKLAAVKAGSTEEEGKTKTTEDGQ